MTGQLLVDRLGAQGDGIADTERGPVYIPFALPGERVTAGLHKDRAELIAVLEASPSRVPPPCRHFGTCGGCAIQHLEPSAYRQWKRGLVVQALRGRGIDAPVEELVPCAPETRRRAAFTARRDGPGMVLGYNQAFSHTIVGIEECPILLPEIVRQLKTLRALAGIVCKTLEPFRLVVTATAAGLDVVAEGSGRLEGAARKAASDFVLANRLARLTVDGEIIVEPQKPLIPFGDVGVHPPPGGFIQAVAGAEDAMAAIAVEHLRKAKKIVDLFAGSGAFALRLAKNSEVHAVEADAAALAALDRGFRFGAGLKKVTVERRDLFRRPLTFKELAAFDGLSFDPPRAGAEDQAKQIARSDVPRVVAISCNPVTLARDLRILLDGGYRVVRIIPIDQFLWTGHVEVVVALEKRSTRR